MPGISCLLGQRLGCKKAHAQGCSMEPSPGREKRGEDPGENADQDTGFSGQLVLINSRGRREDGS